MTSEYYIGQKIEWHDSFNDMWVSGTIEDVKKDYATGGVFYKIMCDVRNRPVYKIGENIRTVKAIDMVEILSNLLVL